MSAQFPADTEGPPGQHRRDDRKTVRIPVRIARQGLSPVSGEIQDITPAGFRLLCTARLDHSQALTIRIANLSPLAFAIRWAEPGVYGCELLQPLHSAVADHLARLHQPGTRPL